jgi:hypothetical protein
MSNHHVQTEIEINVGADRVWEVLTDFVSYPEWNPFIRFIQGIPEKDTRLEVRIQASGTKGMIFRPSVLVADAGQELRWLGRLLMPGIFDGEHRFVIRPLTDGKVLFRHSELFSGMLVPLFRDSLDRDIKRGFDEMNSALKARAEARP